MTLLSRLNYYPLIFALTLGPLFVAAKQLNYSLYFEKPKRLKNNYAYLDVTPHLGGRLLTYGLRGQPSFIKLGKDYYNKVPPKISPIANNMEYLGHIVWVGPQSEWWSRQNLNIKRKASKATWPPDPYLIFSYNQITEKRRSIELAGSKSPITGLIIDKFFQLNKNSSELTIEATANNINPNLKHWDLWFNTRVNADTKIYVPVHELEENLRATHFSPETCGPIEYEYDGEIISVKATKAPRNKIARQGKLFIQPQEGWMAGFHDKQMLLIRFPLEPRSTILSEHGQVEIYANFPEKLDEGLIEMELHGPANQVKVSETWQLFEYKGSDSRESQIEFLKQKI